VKIIALLANSKGKGSRKPPRLDIVTELEEMPFDEEFRVRVRVRVKPTDGSLETTTAFFRVCQSL